MQLRSDMKSYAKHFVPIQYTSEERIKIHTREKRWLSFKSVERGFVKPCASNLRPPEHREEWKMGCGRSLLDRIVS